MIIANPLFDTVFKDLVKNETVGKAIIETLLETEVLDIQLGPTEYNKPMLENDDRPRYLRVDYTALVKTKGGGSQRILIEMQKVHGADDIKRFREYLASAGYAPKDESATLFRYFLPTPKPPFPSGLV
jgi:hypothetical protein